MEATQNWKVLIVEDDDDDFLLLKKAFAETLPTAELSRKMDGEEILEWISSFKLKKGSAAGPHLMLLDLNLPRKDGREVLKEIKSHPQFRKIPVIVFSTSKAQEDVWESYQSGANSYISKPNGYTALLKIVQFVSTYWFRVATLPPV